MLYVVATPIGDVSEISNRAVEILKSCQIVVCESTKEASKLLRALGISGKQYEILDEHTKSDEIPRLAKICSEQDVVLVSDCGTPGFCDPGPMLVSECRRLHIPVKSVLGPSSLMGLLSLVSQRFDQFVFRGFLPAETEARKISLRELQAEKRAVILMDTPYRLQKTLADIGEHFPKRRVLLCLNLSTEEEQILEGRIDIIMPDLKHTKAEFMLLLYPEGKK